MQAEVAEDTPQKVVEIDAGRSHPRSVSSEIEESKVGQPVQRITMINLAPKKETKSELFTGIRKHREGALYLNLIHVARIIMLILVAMHIHERPWIQAICFVTQAEYMIVYILHVMPFESHRQNIL